MKAMNQATEIWTGPGWGLPNTSLKPNALAYPAELEPHSVVFGLAPVC